MQQIAACFVPVVPEIEQADRLAALVAAEREAGIAPDPVRPPGRLASRPIPGRLPNASPPASNCRTRRRSAWPVAADGSLGTQSALARLPAWHRGRGRSPGCWLDRPDDAASACPSWPRPRLPISGGEVIARGPDPRPRAARTLERIEDEWEAAGFPKGEEFGRIVEQALG